MSVSGGFHRELGITDPAVAHGRIRAALEGIGCEVTLVRQTPDGFRLRAVRGANALAVAAAMTPLRWLGIFSRTAIEAKCQRSLRAGDETLHLWVRAHAIRDWDDGAEIDWITRGPEEILGDSVQTRRVLRRLRDAFDASEGALPVPVEPRAPTRAGRRAAFEQRLRDGRRRRNLQIGLALAVLACVYVVVLLLEL